MTRPRLSKCFLSFFLGGLTILQVGCAGKYTGGGFLPSSADRDEKANYGFNFHAIDNDGDGWADGPLDEHKGTLLYHDKAAGVAIRGDVTFAYVTDWDNFRGFAEGTYVNQPLESGSGGRFEVQTVDLGEPGTGSDIFTIRLIGNDGSYYSNAGRIDGGNIQYHPPEEE